ncbi:hypothetical protein [Bacillus infantis]|nr:hypothetical protein [Bacillus infantis]
MKVLIIGGTKFMGPYVIEELYQKGHSVQFLTEGRLKYPCRRI